MHNPSFEIILLRVKGTIPFTPRISMALQLTSHRVSTEPNLVSNLVFTECVDADAEDMHIIRIHLEGNIGIMTLVRDNVVRNTVTYNAPIGESPQSIVENLLAQLINEKGHSSHYEGLDIAELRTVIDVVPPLLHVAKTNYPKKPVSTTTFNTHPKE